MKKTNVPVLLSLFLCTLSSPVAALVIDNDLADGTVGYWSVDVITGGISIDAALTASRFGSGDVVTENVLFEYTAFIDVGAGAFPLLGGAPVSDGEDRVSSSGSFLGAAGNTINWTVVSSIADGSPVMTNTFTFTAETGALGELRLFQYMDEDVEFIGDDVFFSQGSLAGGNLELFTVDQPQIYGVSQSGALSAAQGLDNSSFIGWAVNIYDLMKPALFNRTQSVDPSGVIDNLDPTENAQLGPVRGPADVVSTMAWRVEANAARAVIVTTLGGIPEVSSIAGISAAPATGLQTSESGGTADMSVVLESPPTADVTVALNSSNTAEGRISPADLTFSPSNWNAPQTVTITGVDDDLDDGNVFFRIVLAPAVSADPNYDGVDGDDIRVVNLDDDGERPDILVGAISQTTSEGGTEANITVRLTQPPAANVTIGLTSDDPGEGVIEPSVLVFTVADWQMQRVLTVRGVDDAEVDGDVAYEISPARSVSTDPDYDDKKPASVRMTNIDNDVPAETAFFSDGFE